MCIPPSRVRALHKFKKNVDIEGSVVAEMNIYRDSLSAIIYYRFYRYR